MFVMAVLIQGVWALVPAADERLIVLFAFTIMLTVFETFEPLALLVYLSVQA